MADLQALARARTVGPLRDIALHGGFPYANSPHSGASVWVWADTGEAAARALDEIYAAYEARFADFEPSSSRRPTASAWPCGRRAWWR